MRKIYLMLLTVCMAAAANGQCGGGPFQVFETFNGSLPTQAGTWTGTSNSYGTTIGNIRTGSHYLTFNALADAIATPQIADPLVFSFWYKRSTTTTGTPQFTIETSPDNATWTARGTVNTFTTTYQQFSIDLNALGLTNVYVRIRDTRASGTAERYVDDISWTSVTPANNTINNLLGAGTINISSLPYSATALTTCGNGNNITSNNVTSVCGSTNYYGAEDKTFVFTPTATGVYTILLTTVTDDDAGIMLYSGCPFSGTCIANAQSTTGLTRTIAPTLTNGVTYYLVVDNFPAPACITSFSLDITLPPTCSAPTALNATLITTTTSTINWTAASPAPANGYQYEVRTSGAAGSGPTGLVASGTTGAGIVTAPVSGLTAGTSHTFYVRSDCGGSDFSTWASGTFATLPANDECATATAFPTIPNDGTCVTLSNQTTAGATQSQAACAGTADDDVWYSFLAPATSVIIELTTVSGNADRVHQVFSGACGSLVSVLCSDPETGTASGLTVGSTYYVRVHTFGTGNSTVFNICIKTPPPPPANDECATATAFPTIPNDGTCVTLSNQTTAGATQSQAACAGTADDDVWYSFVAPATTVIIELTTVSGLTDRVHQVFSGACGSLVSVLCSDPETGTATGLTVGSTYYVRVHTWASTGSSVFNICIKTPPPCVNPTTLTAGTLTSTSAVLNWTENGTGTTWDIEIQPSPFTFTGTPTVTGVSRPYTAMGLTPSTGYQFRVRASTCLTNWSASSSTFTTLGTPPANDEVAGAISLTVGGGCTGAPYSNTNATASTNEPYPSCAGTKNAPVWYSFIAPASGAVRITTDLGTGAVMTDPKVGLYSGTDLTNYSDFQIISCDDDNGAVGGAQSILYATGLTSGTIYYIAVDRATPTSTTGTFCIAVDELTSSMISTNTTCASAFQTPFGSVTTYNGWVPLVDVTGNLMAMVKNPAGGSVSLYNNTRQNINAAAVRQSAGVYYLDRNFLINNTTATNVDVQFFYLNSELTALTGVAPATTAANLGAVRQGGTTCQPDFSAANGTTQFLPQTGNGVTADGNVRWIQVQTPSFSNFYLQSSVGPVLPTGLVTFAGQKQGSVNKLVWTTSSEQNNRGFDVQRSTDGINFTSLGFVNSQGLNGASSETLNYTFIDNSPIGAKQYYRLRQYDFDNNSKLSNVVVIKGDKPVTLAIDGLYPNPANTQVNVIIGAPVRDKVTMVIVDVTGKTVLQKVVSIEAGSNTVPVDISRIANGSYLVKLVCSNNCESAVSKFVKQ